MKPDKKNLPGGESSRMLATLVLGVLLGHVLETLNSFTSFWATANGLTIVFAAVFVVLEFAAFWRARATNGQRKASIAAELMRTVEFLLVAFVTVLSEKLFDVGYVMMRHPLAGALYIKQHQSVCIDAAISTVGFFAMLGLIHWAVCLMDANDSSSGVIAAY